MNIILLSGGSGKQLWPLSNDVRSKQFIRLLKSESGEYESMLQRVCRQIITADKDARITVTATMTQVGVIKNQLGDDVSVCMEPCRRDTFPAVALASAYLHDELGVGENESVTVCPVDSFVNGDFYEEVKKLEGIVENTFDMALMGIKPVYPSDEYGYIIPETADKVSKVKRFIEKTNMKMANDCFTQGALWNAGIFTFKLGYLLRKVQGMVGLKKYGDLFLRYDLLPMTSLDKIVAAEESGIQVMRYAGEWKDLGTWNVIAETMLDDIRGSAILDEACENTHIINETDIPILCMGGKNKIIAASNDGILVLDKKYSAGVKRYAEKIENNIYYAEKSWGTYTVIDAQPGSLVAKIGLRAGKRMKYHSHELRDESWTVITGLGKSVVDGMEQFVRPGDVISIAANCKHTLIAETDMNVIEVQTGAEISRDDKRVFDSDDERNC